MSLFYLREHTVMERAGSEINKIMVNLLSMTETDFTEYMKSSVKSYSAEIQHADRITAEAALKIAQDSFQNLLPEGIKTPDHFLYQVISEQKQVGILWFHHKKENGREYAFIYDIEIFASYRGQGFGQATMKAFEEKAKKLGLSSIKLHVFGHNKVAISLYEKLGFASTNIKMEKLL